MSVENLKHSSVAQELKKYKAEILLGVLFILAYVPTFNWMWNRWFSRDSYYTHGILIPFVSAYLIWQKREQLQLHVRKSSSWGMALIVLGILLQFFSGLFRIYFSSGFSMLIVLWGMVLYLYGPKIFREVFFPLAFLFFMIPLPEALIVKISFNLKLFAAHIATKMLNQFGIAAHQQGSVIQMRYTQVIVDDVCSGLRSLISLTALGSLFAYWLQGNYFKKAVLLLSTIPIAVITNVCRIIVLSIISEVWGHKAASGLVHDATGLLVFAFGFIFLFGVSRVLE